MTTVRIKDPCYFEIGLEKENRCTLGHHWTQVCYHWEWSQVILNDPDDSTLQVHAWRFQKSLQNLLLTCSSVALCDQVSHKTPAGCKYSWFYETENRWLIPAYTTNWWHCVGSSLANALPSAPHHCILWRSWGVNSTRKASPVLLSSWTWVQNIGNRCA